MALVLLGTLGGVGGGGGPVAAADITDAQAPGIALLTAADPADARGAIGAGTGNSNLALGATSSTAMPGNKTAADLGGVATTGNETIGGTKTFSASPVVPTPTPGDASTKAATTAFVAAAVTALVNAAPGTLDTLNELAAALGNDPNFAATLTASIGSKAPLSSPALTGTPTAPTPTSTDNSTKIATTAWVRANGSTTTYANAPAGSMFVLEPVAGAWPARPSSRTDITFQWTDFDGTMPSTMPAGYLVGSDIFYQTGTA